MIKKIRVGIVVASIIIVGLVLLSIFSNKQPDMATYGNEEMIEIRNIEISDFDEYKLGVMHQDKYYQLQYGVHLSDTSLIGEHLGKGTGNAQLTAIDGNIYQYSENFTYGVDENASFFKYKGEEDIILVQANEENAINNMWVLAPELLRKTSLYELFENPDINISYYPCQDDISYKYDLTEIRDVIVSTLTRTEDISANRVELGYITFDDGTGLSYGADVYLNMDTGDAYLCPPAYDGLVFKIPEVMYEYYLKYEYERYSDAHSVGELELEVGEGEKTTAN